MRTRTRTCRPYIEILEDRCVPSTFAAFDLDARESGPFPSDRFTVADSSQLTGRRVDLPLPDRATHPSDYDDISVINTLDGFNLQPRLSIPFSGPIDVTTVNSGTVFLIKLDDPTAPEEGGGRVVGINQTVWDVATNTLHVESDELLEQHTRYALIVTRGLRDADGLPVEPSDEFERFRHDLNFGQTHDSALKEYRKDLLDALQAARRAGVAEKDIVAASVFTTMSTTAVLEKIRDQVHASTPAPADFNLGPGGARTVFAGRGHGHHLQPPNACRSAAAQPGRGEPCGTATSSPVRWARSRSESTSRPTTRSTRASSFRRWGRGPGRRRCRARTRSTSTCLALGPAPAAGWPVAI